MLALLLSLQWATAFAHCLAGLSLPAAAGHTVEICSADGLRTLLVGEDGQPAAPTSHAHDSCPLCPGSAAPAPAAPAVAAQPVRYRLPPAAPRLAGLPPAGPRAPPQQPRAPPLA
ncbi:DUF2946 family protein [Roseicella frigidaeris]|uniref:DUF2946 domain-containing protein n=1 Tax=Roseicella frigidaeris TaxID=2230885 RepID=A0A327MGV9_9PROT|nr:DUF2946 family protein [Roseicella frigidaeris]RAI59418.1 hypothetical protein DOO78_07370 [Roseicella frigidaeris]